MRFFWVRDRVKQNHFKIQWERGKVNRADYFTKHHSAAHHKRTRPLYINDQLHVNNSLQRSNLRGCINPITTYVHNILQTSQDTRYTSSDTRLNVRNTTYEPKTHQSHTSTNDAHQINFLHTYNTSFNRHHTNYNCCYQPHKIINNVEIAHNLLS